MAVAVRPDEADAAAGLDEREGAGDARRRRRAPRKRRLLLGACRARATAGTNWVTVGRNGPGRDDPAELLDDDGELDGAEAEAAVRLGDGERRPAELDHLLPERVGRRAVLDDLRGRSVIGHSPASTARTPSRSSSWSSVNSSSIGAADAT